jgi:hypothetical protein
VILRAGDAVLRRAGAQDMTVAHDDVVGTIPR